MPRDLFGDVTRPSIRVGNRKWYAVPLSLAAHTAALVAVVVVPLLATGALPDPRRALRFVPVDSGPIPVPPNVRPVPPESPRHVGPPAPPIEAPSSIEPEPLFDESLDVGVAGAPELLGVGVVGGTESFVAPAPLPAPPPVPVRVGGQVRPPEKLRDVAPVYPAIAQAARVQGVVIVEATIGIDGRVQHARILRSVPLLDVAALAAVQQWTYTPTTLNGVPVPVIMTVTVRFQLQ
jgi:protein TonB